MNENPETSLAPHSIRVWLNAAGVPEYSNGSGNLEVNKNGYIRITCTTHSIALQIKGKYASKGDIETLTAGTTPLEQSVYFAYTNQRLRAFVDDQAELGEWAYRLIFFKDDGTYVATDPRIIVRAAL